MNQPSIFDLMYEDAPATDDVFNVGDKVYRVRLDVVDEMTVTGSFVLHDSRCENGKRTRYHVETESGGHDIFDQFTLGTAFFDNREDAEVVARRNLESGEFNVIRASEIEPIEFKAWEVSVEHSRSLYACCALVKARDSFAVYHKKLYHYEWMDAYGSEAEARKAYAKEMKLVASNVEINYGYVRRYYKDADLRIIDLYGIHDGIWSAPDYVRFNWLRRVEKGAV